MKAKPKKNDIPWQPDQGSYDKVNDSVIAFLASYDGMHSYDYTKMLSIGMYIPYGPPNLIDKNLVSYAQDNLMKRRGIVLQHIGCATALEALLAIAAHYVDFTLNGGDLMPDSDALVSKIFWKMLETMGLTEYTDEKWEEPDSRYASGALWSAFATKIFDNDIDGSPFNLFMSDECLPVNFKKNPYWVQMGWWFDIHEKEILGDER